jgi:RNA polymerase sigma factor (sigma-70 family)
MVEMTSRPGQHGEHGEHGEYAWLAERFEENRPHLRAVAYRMLGSLSEADDAVQDAWLRLSRADTSAVENLTGWLTTVVARVCLNVLQSRKSRREEPLEGLDGTGVRLPDPLVTPADGMDPEHEVLLTDSVGLALLVVLETLAPPERVAFVLHDVFGVPFEEIGPIVERSPAAARQLASRGRRRVQGGGEVMTPDVDVRQQRALVNAFLAASRGGDFEALLAVLDPAVVLRSDRVGVSRVVRGAQAVASQALLFSRAAGASGMAQTVQPVLVNGVAGIVSWGTNGQPLSIMSFTVRGGRIVEIHVLTDRERLKTLELAVPTGGEARSE